MHCPVCGAENDVDAAICADCGASLEDQVAPRPDDDDRTIISPLAETIIDAEKVEVLSQDDDQEDVTTAAPAGEQEEEISVEEPQPVASEPPGDDDTGPGNGGELRSRRNLIIMIIAVVAVLLFLCCCLSAILGGTVAVFSEQSRFTLINLRPLAVLVLMSGLVW